MSAAERETPSVPFLSEDGWKLLHVRKLATQPRRLRPRAEQNWARGRVENNVEANDDATMVAAGCFSSFGNEKVDVDVFCFGRSKEQTGSKFLVNDAAPSRT